MGTCTCRWRRRPRFSNCSWKGMSIRSAERITGVHRNTIMRLLVVAGDKCGRLLDSRIRNLRVSDIQADEIWGFVGKKEAHKWPFEVERKEIGDAYCFVGLERHSKLVLAWHLGKRSYVRHGRFCPQACTGYGSASLPAFDGWIPELHSLCGSSPNPAWRGLRATHQGLWIVPRR